MSKYNYKEKSVRGFVVLGLLVATVSAYGQVRLSADDAAKLIVDKPEAVYPSLAKQLRLQGTVKADVTVSEAGAISSTKLMSGHPMLVTAAMDAIKRYIYKPYIVDGKPVPFVTTVEIPFSVGIPKKEYEEQQSVNNRYFVQADRCRDLLKSRKWTEAEKVCKAAVPIANQLPDYQWLTKMSAYENVGHVLLAERRFQDALDYYSRSFEFAQSNLKETDVELGYAYRNLALANHGLGNLDKARDLYGKAEKTLQLAYGNIGTDELKRRYPQGMKEILTYHALAAEQAGATAEAQEIRKRLSQQP